MHSRYSDGRQMTTGLILGIRYLIPSIFRMATSWLSGNQSTPHFFCGSKNFFVGAGLDGHEADEDENLAD